MICQYLPEALQPHSFEGMDFDLFFEYLAMAQEAREMQVQDIETGVINGIAKLMEGE